MKTLLAILIPLTYFNFWVQEYYGHLWFVKATEVLTWTLWFMLVLGGVGHASGRTPEKGE
jgi:hypothetical protein